MHTGVGLTSDALCSKSIGVEPRATLTGGVPFRHVHAVRVWHINLALTAVPYHSAVGTNLLLCQREIMNHLNRCHQVKRCWFCTLLSSEPCLSPQSLLPSKTQLRRAHCPLEQVKAPALQATSFATVPQKKIQNVWQDALITNVPWRSACTHPHHYYHHSHSQSCCTVLMECICQNLGRQTLCLDCIVIL